MHWLSATWENVYFFLSSIRLRGCSLYTFLLLWDLCRSLTSNKVNKCPCAPATTAEVLFLPTPGETCSIRRFLASMYLQGVLQREFASADEKTNVACIHFPLAVWLCTCPVLVASFHPAANLQSCREPSAQPSCLNHGAATFCFCAEMERFVCRHSLFWGDQYDLELLYLWQSNFSIYNNLCFCRAS